MVWCGVVWLWRGWGLCVEGEGRRERFEGFVWLCVFGFGMGGWAVPSSLSLLRLSGGACPPPCLGWSCLPPLPPAPLVWAASPPRLLDGGDCAAPPTQGGGREQALQRGRREATPPNTRQVRVEPLRLMYSINLGFGRCLNNSQK